MNANDRLGSLTTTVSIPRQTPKSGFNELLGESLERVTLQAANLTNIGLIPHASAAVAAVQSVNRVTQMEPVTTASAVTGVQTTPTLADEPLGGPPANFSGYMAEMRSESDRQMMMQMSLQKESREYNTLTNVIKMRHDSAKAAINNIR